jgi:hypothetical protein
MMIVIEIILAKDMVEETAMVEERIKVNCSCNFLKKTTPF